MTEARRPEAWIATIAPEEAEGRLKEAYDWQAQRLGSTTEYTQLGSLHPELVYERLRLYQVIDQLDSGLTHQERQIVIYVTSVLNETPYCASGARDKLRISGVSDDLVSRIVAEPFAPATGYPRLDALVVYTATLTRTPGAISEGDIDGLRAVGLSDADIVALNDLSAYFSYANRVATGLGLRSEVPSEHAVGAPR